MVSVDSASVDIARNHIGHTRWHTVCRWADVCHIRRGSPVTVAVRRGWD